MNKNIRRGLVAAVLAVAVAVAAIGGVAQGASTRVVTLKSKRFHPASITIKKGTKVTWKWADPAPVPHNVTSKRFKSSTTKSSGTYSVTFRKRGTFTYNCTIHPGMNGKVVVK
jgi:plastocyanin